MSEPVIDPATFTDLQDTAGADFVVELVGTFFAEAPPMLAEMRAAAAVRAAERLRRAAHSLKSNALTFGALRLAAQARALELGGLPAAEGATAGDPLQALEAAYAEAAAALRELTHG